MKTHCDSNRDDQVTIEIKLSRQTVNDLKLAAAFYESTVDEMIVITSYSIHYTKLYEPGATRSGPMSWRCSGARPEGGVAVVTNSIRSPSDGCVSWYMT